MTEVSLDFTEDELVALWSALDGLDPEAVPDLEVYEVAKEKIDAAYDLILDRPARPK